MTSPDKEFKIRGGDSQHVAIYNRIACLARVKHLTGVDLQRKSIWYRYALDLEMYQRWYKAEPKNKPIDEEFCQRMATVVKDMEKDADVYDEAQELGGRVASAYKMYKKLPAQEKEEEVQPKKTIINGIQKWFNKKGGK